MCKKTVEETVMYTITAETTVAEVIMAEATVVEGGEEVVVVLSAIPIAVPTAAAATADLEVTVHQ